MVVAMLNGTKHKTHLVEESCYSPCRYKCHLGNMFGSSGKIILGDSEVESMVLSEPKSPKDGKAMTIRQQDDDHNRWNNITQRIDGQSNEARPMGSNHWSLSLSQINIVIGQIATMESNKVESQPRVQQSLTKKHFTQKPAGFNHELVEKVDMAKMAI